MLSPTGMQKAEFGTQGLRRHSFGDAYNFVLNNFLPLCLAVPHIKFAQLPTLQSLATQLTKAFSESYSFMLVLSHTVTLGPAGKVKSYRGAWSTLVCEMVADE